MNRYQKLFNKHVKLYIISYKSLFGDKCNHTYRWHRSQMRLMLKEDNENNIETLKYWNVQCRKNLIEQGCIKDINSGINFKVIDDGELSPIIDVEEI